MKLHATISEFEANVEIRREADGILATVDGVEYKLAVQNSDRGSSLLIFNGRVFDCRVEGRAESGKPVDVFIGTDRFSVTLTDPKRLRSSAGETAQADEAARIIAPMPGKVVRVLVSPGDHVEAGAGIVVVEAMKMQNEMKSPKAGRVSALSVQVGATVNGGDVLAVIE
jgi:biotin carboxyl carrier protein